MIESADSDGRIKGHKSNISGGRKLEKICEKLKRDSGIDQFHPKPPLGILIPSLPPPTLKEALLAVPSKAECNPFKSISKELGPHSRASAREKALNRAAVRLGKPKKRWVRRQRKGKGRNRVKPLNWWQGRYLTRANFHKAGDPRFKVSIRCPPINLPEHHCIDSVVVSNIFDDHLCLCDRRHDQALTFGDPAQCWCVSSIRELTVKFIIESSAHQNANLMDTQPDP